VSAAPNRPRDLLVLALRRRSGTPSVDDSLHDGKAGEQQATREIKTEITGLGYTGGQQGFERRDIAFGQLHLPGATAQQDVSSTVINRGQQMLAKHDLSVGGKSIGIVELLEWTNRRRTLVRPGTSSESLGKLIKICVHDGVGKRGGNQFDVWSHRTPLSDVDTKREGGAYGWIIGQSLQRLVHQLLGERITSPDMYAQRQMGADAAQSSCRMEISTGQIEAVAWPKQRLQ
jgi:hypothetical protein